MRVYQIIGMSFCENFIFTAELQTGSLNPLAALQSDNKITAFNCLFCDDYLMYFPNMPFNQLANHETDGSVLSVAVPLENML